MQYDQPTLLLSLLHTFLRYLILPPRLPTQHTMEQKLVKDPRAPKDPSLADQAARVRKVTVVNLKKAALGLAANLIRAPM